MEDVHVRGAAHEASEEDQTSDCVYRIYEEVLCVHKQSRKINNREQSQNRHSLNLDELKAASRKELPDLKAKLYYIVEAFHCYYAGCVLLWVLLLYLILQSFGYRRDDHIL